MFRNLRLSVKLIGGFSIVLFLFICVMGIYHYGIETTTTNFSNLMKIDVAISSHAARTQILMQQCRVAEKNFLAGLDLQYRDIVTEKVKAIIAEGKKIADLSQKGANKAASQKAAGIVTHITAYLSDFQQLVSAYQKKGLDAKSGIRGNFQKIVDRFMEGMTQHEVDEYYISLLKLARFENEYLITKHERSGARVLKTIEELIELTQEQDISQVKKIIVTAFQDFIPQYKDAFLKLMDEGEGDSLKSLNYRKMRAIRQEAGEMIAASYFRGGKEMALDIRLFEKEYLLSGKTEYSDAALNAADNLMEGFKKSSVNRDFIKEALRNLKRYKNELETLVKVDQEINGLLLTMKDAVLKIEPLISELDEKAREDAAAREQEVKGTNKGKNCGGHRGMCYPAGYPAVNCYHTGNLPSGQQCCEICQNNSTG